MAGSNNQITMGGWGRATASPQFGRAEGSPAARPQPPLVQLVGDINHADFREAIGLLRNDSRLIASVEMSPELIVLAQSRPDSICSDVLNDLRRAAPLAGIITLAGSWCEGEMRTGRPWPGAQRLYWYEFPAWWRRQIQLHAANRCPDWTRPATQLPRLCVPGHPRLRSGLIVLRTPRRDNADALADVLNQAGHSTAWQRHDRARTHTRGAFAGIWDGGQLNDAETADLEMFCARMSRDGAPVVVLLDFPRRDRTDGAYGAGATVVLGKPWLKVDLLTAVDIAVETPKVRRAA
jgi:hypothetical protein